jgi:hypothetical protein
MGNPPYSEMNEAAFTKNIMPNWRRHTEWLEKVVLSGVLCALKIEFGTVFPSPFGTRDRMVRATSD